MLLYINTDIILFMYEHYLTNSLTHSLTHSLMYSLTDSLTHSLTHTGRFDQMENTRFGPNLLNALADPLHLHTLRGMQDAKTALPFLSPGQVGACIHT